MLDHLIIKVAAPCNLRCTYCYEYFAGDESWKTMPKHISIDIIKETGRKIKDYCNLTGLEYFQITLHGGEPLLLGKGKLEKLISILRNETNGIKLNIGIQTNGVLINEEIASWFKNININVGISLDGDQEANSRRVDIKGASTFEKTVNSIKLMQKFAPNNLLGILSVINLETNAKKSISFLCSLKPSQLDLLLPFETYNTLKENRKEWSNKLGNWLNEAFDTWFTNKEFSKTKIRIFEDILQSILTNQPKTDWFGVRNVSYLVVGTNGDIDILDHLKIIGNSSIHHRSTYKNIMNDSILSAENVANEILDKFKAKNLPDNCKSCEWSNKCHGGYLPHRFSISNNFNNPSVACEAILKIYKKSSIIMNNQKNKIS